MDPTEYSIKMEEYRALTEKGLASIAAEAEKTVYPKLAEAMFYSVNVGGKRIRPCLVLAVCDMLGGDLDTALPFACALEMIHTYSLIHDDMPCVDNDDMRRGKPSNHKVFGEGMALFAGCGLLSLAFEVMTDAVMRFGGSGPLAAMREIARRSGAGGMLSGQAADIENEGSSNCSEETLRYIHARKTADMLKAAVLAGAYIAGADKPSLAALELYSDKMGLLFQITDDILDHEGDPVLMGKTLGKDARESKKTFVTMLGVEGAREAARRAAEEAVEAASQLQNSDFLRITIEKMLVRSN